MATEDLNTWTNVNEKLPRQGQRTDIYLDCGRRVNNYHWKDFDLKKTYYPHSITHWKKRKK